MPFSRATSVKKQSPRMREILELAPVVPVLVLPDPEVAVPLAQALVDGGLPVIEVTMRTRTALDSVIAIRKQVPGAVVGAGTVISADMAKECHEAGCEFLVSPGATGELIKVARIVDVPFLPGVATASEAMGLHAEGYSVCKFFPAGPAGGADYLKALAGPLPHLSFCPTGGIDATSALDYLALPNVVAVGGSWVAPKDAVEAGDFERIRDLAAQAAAMQTAAMVAV